APSRMPATSTTYISRRAKSLSSPPKISMPPATATAANAMKPATGPVIDCWICWSGPSHGRPPPPLARAGWLEAIAIMNAERAATLIHLCDIALTLPCAGLEFVLSVGEALDMDDVTHHPP